MSTRTASIRQLQQESTKRNTGQRGIPAPFAQAPSELEPFLRTLQKSKLYIVHLDKVPWQFKRKIFSVPLLTNFALASLIAWRLFVIVPFYRDLFFAAIGYDNDVLMDRTEKATGTLIWLTLERALSLLFDYLLIAFAAPWVATFFFGMPSNPALWRWRIGFRDTEIVVRVSQKWGTAEFWEGFTAVPQTNEQGNAVMKNRIMPAVDPQWMHGRTSYLMMGKDFNLDFASMVNATNLTRKGTMKESSFEKTVLVYSETHGWLAWEVHRLDEGSEEEARKKIILFKVCQHSILVPNAQI